VLLEEYAQSGSESAFRELVSRYIGLVYSTALRLVSGDTHRAEDVAQMMFINLARKAPSLPNGVALGGWLHQSAYNIAAPMMRAERRRQGREREAVQMNALHDDSNADLSVHTITDGESSTVNEARGLALTRAPAVHDFDSLRDKPGESEAYQPFVVQVEPDHLARRIPHKLDCVHAQGFAVIWT
jgi:DNA-directed RNA polymerase specialized sigma24 family protein